MTELLTKNDFSIDTNDFNQNAFCLIHVDLDDKGEPFDWTFIYANKVLAELEGKSIEELIGHRFFEIFPEGNRKWLKPYYEAAYLGKGANFDDISEEINRYLHVDVYPTSKTGYCVCTLFDIKESVFQRAQQREARERLLEDLERERKLNIKIHDFAMAMGTVYPLAINIDYKNDHYHMIEYDKFLNKTAAESGTIDELIRVGASTIPDPKQAADFWALFNREATIAAFKQGRKELTLRHTQYGDDGKIHYMDTRVLCTECSEDKIEAISLSRCIDDEAERDFAIERAASHAEVINAISTIYTTIMEADIPTHGYKIIKSVELMMTATNDQTSGDFDLVKESILESFMIPEMREDMRSFLDLGTLDERLRDVDTIVTEYKDKNGRWFEARFIAQQRDEEGHLLTALYVARNISREKAKELSYKEQLKASAIEADKANISKTNFLRRMSHDIRTPLNGIIGMLRIAERYRSDSEKLDECMSKIKHSANYLLDLVNNVLDISKLESGSIVLEHKPFNIAQVLLNTLPLIETAANEHSIIFSGGRDASHIVHKYVFGSPLHLNRVLMNVASNAVKYNRPGGSIKIYANEIAFDGDNATYEFVCSDTGLGMSKEFQKQAFNPFSQEGKETTTSFSGSGLGLSIVKDIIELMGGYVELKSEENVGTTVRMVMSFPIDKEHKEIAAVPVSSADIDVSGRKALLVEDNELNMEIAKIMLEEKGLVVTEANNGLIALYAFKESAPYTFDYIFMDMMMPVMDGIEATKEIRALNRPDATTVPIIAMTANAFAEDRKLCLDAGMNDHVGKPIEPHALNSAIQKYAKK